MEKIMEIYSRKKVFLLSLNKFEVIFEISKV